MIKAIIFDYDGVIVDSFRNCFNVYKKICAGVGVKCPSNIEKFKKIYGYNYWEAYKNLGIKPKNYEKAGAIFNREIIKQNPKLFSGIGLVVKKLSQSYKLILATSNLKKEAVQKLKRFSLFEYFINIIGVEGNKKFKKSRAISVLLKKMKIKKREIIFIGDRDIDYDFAQKAGLRNVLLVKYGWGYSKNKIKNQKLIIRKPLDILKAVRSL